MNKTDAMRELRTAAADLPAKAASARAALNQMRRKAQDLTVQARSRARGELERRRITAADTLESLAGALRPDAARARRKTLAIAGGSTLALTAALGVGVALGFMMSRQLKKRAEQQRVETGGAKEGSPMPQAPQSEPITAGLEALT